MSLRKYQSVEKTQVVSPEEHRKIGAATRKTGKTSLKETSLEERRSVLATLDAVR